MLSKPPFWDYSKHMHLWIKPSRVQSTFWACAMMVFDGCDWIVVQLLANHFLVHFVFCWFPWLGVLLDIYHQVVFAITGMCLCLCALFCEGVTAQVFSFVFLRDDIDPFCAWFSFVSVWFLMVLSTFCVWLLMWLFFYLVGHHHWASIVVSWAHVLIPLLWKLDNFASFLVVAL